MKFQIASLMFLALLATSGCRTTNVSSAGGITPINEQFSITVPTPLTIAQGGNVTVGVMLNRGAYFKQNVRLVLNTEGISVTPGSRLVLASDKPQVPFLVSVARDAAIGEYRVAVTGTPESGSATSTVFIVRVTAQ